MVTVDQTGCPTIIFLKFGMEECDSIVLEHLLQLYERFWKKRFYTIEVGGFIIELVRELFLLSSNVICHSCQMTSEPNKVYAIYQYWNPLND